MRWFRSKPRRLPGRNSSANSGGNITLGLRFARVYTLKAVADVVSSRCVERLQLVNNYNDCVHAYATLVQDIRDLIETGFQTEVEVLSRTCRTAWGAAETARLALFRHEADHYCRWGLSLATPLVKRS